uniref:Auxin response factor n=1 Tax=Kalanchoe fedtschenkoi TaxID=63787 RepID=A0A7N0U5Q3_KALFE
MDGRRHELDEALWHGSAGHDIYIPQVGDLVAYFPQGHLEQVKACTNHDDDLDTSSLFKLPSKILCSVIDVQLKAESKTDEVFARITLHPEAKQEMSEWEEMNDECRSASIRNVKIFSKILTSSDTSPQGGFTVPKRFAEEALPSLDMSQQPPIQDLTATDIHGKAWTFRHIFRGNPKRHLLTCGWHPFLNNKQVAAGDTCIFVRGSNGELRIGIRRALRKENSTTSVISGHDMQLGALASAFNALLYGTIFVVYYHPWTRSSDFIVPYAKYVKSVKIQCSIGARFTTSLEGEESERKRSTGRVIAIDDLDCLRWPGSEWKRLKICSYFVFLICCAVMDGYPNFGIDTTLVLATVYVDQVEWEAGMSEKLVRPGRISLWSIESLEPDRRGCMLLPPSKKLSRPGLLPTHVNDGNGITLQGSSSSCQGRGNKGTGAPVPSCSWPSSDPFPAYQCAMQIDKFNPQEYYSGASTYPLGLQGASSPLLSLWPSASGDGGESSNMADVNGRFLSHDPDEANGLVAKQKELDKHMVFGFNLASTLPEFPSPRPTTASHELHRRRRRSTPMTSPSTCDAKHVSEPRLTEANNHCMKLGCCLTLHDTHAKVKKCLQVRKHGCKVSISIDLTRFNSYKEVIFELDQMFKFEGKLIDGSREWQVTYIDHEVEYRNSLLMIRISSSHGILRCIVGNWWYVLFYINRKFKLIVKRLLILPKECMEEQLPAECCATAAA